MKTKIVTGMLGAAAIALSASVASGATLDDVKSKGHVQCGVNTGLAGFAAPDSAGKWTGFDVFEKLDEVNATYDQGGCDVYTTDQSGLYSIRLTLAAPDDHVVLKEIISKEPLGPAVRQGDDQWLDIVKWVSNALIVAEELGVTQANVDEMKNSPNPEIRRLLGVEQGTSIGTDLGLTNEWAYNVIKAVGNYGEVFERNIGQDTPLKIARGLNQLWTKGGIQYAPPIR